MKGNPKVIDYLNKALRHELTAVNQYWLHYRLLDNWGYKVLAKQWRKESIEEMQHADKLIERIIFLRTLSIRSFRSAFDPLRRGGSCEDRPRGLVSKFSGKAADTPHPAIEAP